MNSHGKQKMASKVQAFASALELDFSQLVRGGQVEEQLSRELITAIGALRLFHRKLALNIRNTPED